MFQDEKKKKESLSWIDEILSGEEDPLAGILKKMTKKNSPAKIRSPKSFQFPLLEWAVWRIYFQGPLQKNGNPGLPLRLEPTF